MRVGDTGRVDAVCVVHAELEVRTKIGRTAIDKRPVDGRVAVGVLGVDGDHVCNTAYHGGRDQAVYAYAAEDARRWATELDRDLPPGWFGENLRVTGLPLSDAVLGARCAIGDTLLEVSAPRVPCATFQQWTGEPRWVKRFALQADTGVYFRVLTEGSIAAGDEVRVVHVPEHGITVRDVFTGADPARLARLRVEEPTISAEIHRQIDRHTKSRTQDVRG
ncbi:MOSC domain-containing protein [Nocardia halotolerans]|uniref:MOSC domain-containing protein n=1 Tax=Nocardia halotolerans TaxID=1755878 RepID=A0ABV8VRB4_9NOCA